jgi:para-nitrobenzyl esterase
MATSTPVVDTRQGKLQGQTEDDLHVFRGIPFAAPPVGELRFRAPRPPEPWDGIREANEVGAGSIQTFVQGLELLGAWEMPVDEDCLTLNIWTPGLDDARRPVMFWIHGGGFAAGSGATPIYDGQHLARRGDVVVVTINYRLGALGYLYNQAFTDGDDPHSGNYGMPDQVAALEWVRDHISAFGGDPNNVTIFGESAGGMSVGVLLGAAEAEGLFQRAIPQSGAGHHSLPVDTAEEVCRRFCAILEVSPDDADSLRSIPAQDILDAQNAMQANPETAALTGRYLMPFSPVVEGGFLETLPIEAVRNGRSKDVDLLCGTIEDEWTLLAALGGVNEMDEAGARGALAVTSGDAETADRLYEHYRDTRAARGAGSDPLTVFDSVMTDYVFRIPSDRLLDAHSALDGSGKTYAYLFNQQSPALDGRLRAPHAIDIPFVWGTCDAMRQFVGDDPQTDQLTGFTMDAWIAFARNGNPSTNALPGWPQYRADQRYTMALGPDVKTLRVDREQEREIWSSDLLE